MTKYTKYIVLILTFMSCNHNQNKEITFYYEYKDSVISSFTKIDTIKDVAKIPKHQKGDSLLSQVKIYYKNQEHLISKYIDAKYISGVYCDDGSIFYELDNLGIIYSKSIIWESFKLLKSTNDSINHLINFALDNIISHKELSPWSIILQSQPESQNNINKEYQRLIILNKNNNFVVFEYNKLSSFKLREKSKNKSTTLIELEIKDLDLILEDCFQKEGLGSLIQYKRQYIPFINNNGEKEVWINAFSRYKENWFSRIKLVEDGGKCYFNVLVVLNNKLYYNLSTNCVT